MEHASQLAASVVGLLYVSTVYYTKWITSSSFRANSYFLYSCYGNYASMFKAIQLDDLAVELGADSLHTRISAGVIELDKDGVSVGAVAICGCCFCLGRL